MAKNPMMDAIRRLKVQNGDIIVIKRDAATKDELVDFVNRLSRMGKDKVMVLSMDNPDDISALNEVDMNRHGWFRARKIIPLRNRLVDESEKGTHDEQI